MPDPMKYPIRADEEERKWPAGYIPFAADIAEMDRRLALYPELVAALEELVRQSEPLFQAAKAGHESAFGEPPPATAWDPAVVTLARAKGAQT